MPSFGKELCRARPKQYRALIGMGQLSQLSLFTGGEPHTLALEVEGLHARGILRHEMASCRSPEIIIAQEGKLISRGGEISGKRLARERREHEIQYLIFHTAVRKLRLLA
ncbi:MAG TPA: hypothetical protein VFY89_04610 [Ktedonobacterales bacterium]